MSGPEKTITDFKRDVESSLDPYIGQQISAHGKEWIVIKTLYNDCYLAIGAYEELPCNAHVICTREEDINGRKS